MYKGPSRPKKANLNLVVSDVVVQVTLTYTLLRL